MNVEHPADLAFMRFLNHELPESEAAELRRHLSVCRECMELYLDMREMEDSGLFRKKSAGTAVLPPYPGFETDGYAGSASMSAAAFTDSPLDDSPEFEDLADADIDDIAAGLPDDFSDGDFS